MHTYPMRGMPRGPIQDNYSRADVEYLAVCEEFVVTVGRARGSPRTASENSAAASHFARTVTRGLALHDGVDQIDDELTIAPTSY